MSLAGTLGGNTSDQARPFEKGRAFLVPLEPIPEKCKKVYRVKNTKRRRENDSI